MHGAIRIEDLRHADFSADDACHHGKLQGGCWLLVAGC
jgi:hypothetical protein